MGAGGRRIASERLQDRGFSQRLAKTVARRRKALRLSQDELALIAGCSRPFLSDLERAKATLRLDVVLRVLFALGLDLAIVEVPPSTLTVHEAD